MVGVTSPQGPSGTGLTLREVLDRYGPSLALILSFIVLAVVLPANTHATTSGSSSATPAGETAGAAEGAESAGTAGNGPAGDASTAATAGDPARRGGSAPGSGTGSASGPASGRSTGGAGTGTNGRPAATAEIGAYKCRKDGRQAGISVYLPPCRQFNGDNGGATAQGVSSTAIKFAYYVPRSDAATQAAVKAGGISDDQAGIDRTMEVLRRYFNDHYQTYGREVQFTKVDASGPASDDVAAKADARRIASGGYFGVVTAGGSANPTFDATIASLKLICVGCGGAVGQSTSFYAKTAGYYFNGQASRREIYEAMGEYWAKKLKGQNAAFAGPGPVNRPPTAGPTDLRNRVRKFGLIWLNATAGNVDPGQQEERDNFVQKILPKWGIDPKTSLVDASYNYDITQAPAAAQTIISKFNSSGVTTIAIVGEALTPVYFTQEATREGYFPEWFHTGVGLTDTSFWGRTYDAQQWSHSFGLTLLKVIPDSVALTDGYREYHHACAQAGADCTAGAEGNGVNAYEAALQVLFTGVHMAGPHLTAQSFAQGMYDYPLTGGTPGAQLFGFSRLAPTRVKDFAEVWWNPDSVGNDETGKRAAGQLVRANGGRRFRLGSIPAGPPTVFGADPRPATTDDGLYSGANRIPHEDDGHLHPPAERCLSCGGPGR